MTGISDDFDIGGSEVVAFKRCLGSKISILPVFSCVSAFMAHSPTRKISKRPLNYSYRSFCIQSHITNQAISLIIAISPQNSQKHQKNDGHPREGRSPG